MLSSLAIVTRGPTHNFAGAWEFVAVVLLAIVVIFVRMYGRKRK
jgi:hypothetical protein